MRVALCLSGQARFLETCYHESMKPNIIDVYHPDVFIHTWDPTDNIGKPFINGGGFAMGDPIGSTLIDDMLTLYNPLKVVVEPQVSFEYGKWANRLMSGIRSDHLYSMFYSVQKANELKKQTELEGDFKYDWVIRIRFDMALPGGIPQLSSLDSSKLWVANGCFDTTNGYLDSFGYSSSEIMDVYANIYNSIDHIADNNPDMNICGEYILRKYIDGHNIEVSQIGSHKAYR